MSCKLECTSSDLRSNTKKGAKEISKKVLDQAFEDSGETCVQLSIFL